MKKICAGFIESLILCGVMPLTVFAESDSVVVPETGNVGLIAYLVPAALFAITVVAKKKK